MGRLAAAASPGVAVPDVSERGAAAQSRARPVSWALAHGGRDMDRCPPHGHAFQWLDLLNLSPRLAFAPGTGHSLQGGKATGNGERKQRPASCRGTCGMMLSWKHTVTTRRVGLGPGRRVVARRVSTKPSAIAQGASPTIPTGRPGVVGLVIHL
jgi:hypothetical protein